MTDGQKATKKFIERAMRGLENLDTGELLTICSDLMAGADPNGPEDNADQIWSKLCTHNRRMILSMASAMLTQIAVTRFEQNQAETN